MKQNSDVHIVMVRAVAPPAMNRLPQVLFATVPQLFCY